MPPRKLSAVCDERVANEVERLAREYGVSPQEVVRQLVERGLEDVR